MCLAAIKGHEAAGHQTMATKRSLPADDQVHMFLSRHRCNRHWGEHTIVIRDTDTVPQSQRLTWLPS